MRIAIIGSGGREHAISWKLAQSELADKIFVLPGNGGTKNKVNISGNDFAGIKEFCIQNRIELIFVGPEDPLVNGIVDFFSDLDIKVFGPDQAAAQLEGSKIFAKNFMRKYGVATADFWEFSQTSETNRREIVRIIQKLQGNCVIKYDGLAAGKGVFVCSNIEEATSALQILHSQYGEKACYLIEEKLIGDELSILAFTDGDNYQLLLPSQDHKQLLDGDKGPNTGGMGAFCPVPFYTEELKNQIERDIIKPTIKGIKAEGFNYKGVVYFGLMITNAGPKVLEYNVRLGDPETEVVLPALKSDLLKLVLACFDGTLKDYKMDFHSGYFVDVVLVSGGYPQLYQKGFPICGLEKNDDLIFHAGTKKENGKIVTSGGRVLNVVAWGKSLTEAVQAAYFKTNNYYFEKMFYRKDIGRRGEKA